MTLSKKILLLGVTASGKARLAFDLARHLHGEIVSVDSMKIYRRMDIGTAKPSKEAQLKVPYHMIDVVEPSEPYDVATFYERATREMDKIQLRRRPTILVGGTAMYIKALLYGLFAGPGADDAVRQRLKQRVEAQGLDSLHQELARVDPAAAGRINPKDERRIVRALEVFELTGQPISSLQTQFDAAKTPSEWIIIGLRRDKTLESQRINARVKKMVEAGLVREVQSLLSEEPCLSKQTRSAIGYAEIIDHLAGGMDIERTIEQIKISTRRLAKGQRTWFKTFPFVHWITLDDESTAEKTLHRTLRILAYEQDTGSGREGLAQPEEGEN